MLLSRIITAALLGGGAAGLMGGILHLAYIQPVLLHAELYESGQAVHFGTAAVGDPHPPAFGFDLIRGGLSLGFFMVFYIGYGLILAAMMGLAVRLGHGLDVPRGVFWGLAGFAAVHLAPAFSLPPEVPGVAAADITARQIWWSATAAATAGGCWLLAFHQRRGAVLAAVVVMLAPHIIGAPEAPAFAGTVPPELASLFAARTLGGGLIAWLTLGVCIARFMQTEGVVGHLTAEKKAL